MIQKIIFNLFATNKRAPYIHRMQKKRQLVNRPYSKRNASNKENKESPNEKWTVPIVWKPMIGGKVCVYMPFFCSVHENHTMKVYIGPIQIDDVKVSIVYCKIFFSQFRSLSNALNAVLLIYNLPSRSFCNHKNRNTFSVLLQNKIKVRSQ